MTTQSPILHIDDDVFSCILERCLYGESELSTSVHYVDHTTPGAAFSQRQSIFASNTVLVSRHFYRVGMGVLWKYIVVRSREHLLSLAQQARGGPASFVGSPLGVHTVRLDVRIRGHYDFQIFSAVLRQFQGLEILVWRNTLDGPTADAPRLPSAVSNSLLGLCPELKRLEFDSPHDLPSEVQFRDVVNAKRMLRSLRITNVALPDTATLLAHPLFTEPFSRLTTLSLGYDHWSYRVQDMRSDIESLVASLAAEPVLPHLANLHFLDSIMPMRDMCATYGNQLRELLCVAPDANTMSVARSRPHLLEMCPNVEHLQWVLLDYPFSSERPLSALPPFHAQLHTITVVYAAKHAGEQCLIVGVVEAAWHVYAQDYPALREVRFQRRHDEVGNTVMNSEWWLGDVQEVFKDRNVQVVLVN